MTRGDSDLTSFVRRSISRNLNCGISARAQVEYPVWNLKSRTPQGAFGKTMSRLRLIIGSTSILLVTNMSFLTTGVKNSANLVITRRVMQIRERREIIPPVIVLLV